MMTVAASIEALPVHYNMFTDGGFPIDESLAMAGNPGGGSTDDISALAPDAAVFAGQRLGDDGSCGGGVLSNGKGSSKSSRSSPKSSSRSNGSKPNTSS